MADEVVMTAYDVAKQIVSQQEQISVEEYDALLHNICDDLSDARYLMLICPELRQFVVIHMRNNLLSYEGKKNALFNELKEILNNRGRVWYGEKDGEWEIWIKDRFNHDFYAYQLVDYTEGVVEI